MQFTPKSKDEIDRDGLLPAGVYDFTVVKAENATSKKGNPMIALNMQVAGVADGREGYANDWLMEAMLAKMYEFCEATGLSDKYHEGTLDAEDCMDKSGQLRLVIQEDKTGNYGPRNSVKKYITSKDAESVSSTKTHAADSEESPFA